MTVAATTAPATTAPATVTAATAASILDVAQAMTQSVGYNGLSFRDVAAAVGIRSASVHYHFPSKASLAAAVARRYTDTLMAHLGDLDERITDPAAALRAYMSLVRTAFEADGKMCLCGMLAVEADAVPPEVRVEVRRFIDLNVQWIAGVLGRKAGAPRSKKAVREHAIALLATVEGALLVARGSGDIADFDAVATHLCREGVLSR